MANARIRDGVQRPTFDGTELIELDDPTIPIGGPSFPNTTSLLFKNWINEAQTKIIWLRDNGNDTTGDGLSIERSVATLPNAETKANALAPDASNRVAIKCDDDGLYTLASPLYLRSYIDMDLKNARIDGVLGTSPSSTSDHYVALKAITGEFDIQSINRVEFTIDGEIFGRTDNDVITNKADLILHASAVTAQGTGKGYVGKSESQIFAYIDALWTGDVDLEVGATDKTNFKIKGNCNILGDITAADKTKYRAIINGDFNGDITTTGTGIVEITCWEYTGTPTGNNIDIVQLKSINERFIDGLKSPTGFIDSSQAEILYNPISRQITVQPKAPATSFDYYLRADKYTITSAQQKTHPDTSGIYYFYWDSTNTLQFSTTEYNILTDVLISYVVYDDALTDGFANIEYHASKRNPEAHLEFHLRFGAYLSDSTDFIAANYVMTPSSPVNDDNTFSITSGVLADEDLQISLPALPDDGPYTIIYKDGAAGNWKWQKSQAVPFLHDTNYIQYNHFSGGNWILTEVATNNYVNIWVLKNSSIDSDFETLIVQPQNVYTSLGAAQAETINDVDFTNFPIIEDVIIYRFTYRTSAAYTTLGKVRIEEVERLGDISTRIVQAPISLPDRANILYINGYGSDSNNGKKPEDSFATPGAAYTEAVATSRSATNRIVNEVIGDGYYSSTNLAINHNYIDISAPYATFDGSSSATINIQAGVTEANFIHAKRLQNNATVSTLGKVNNSTGTTHLNIGSVYNAGDGIALSLIAPCEGIISNISSEKTDNTSIRLSQATVDDFYCLYLQNVEGNILCEGNPKGSVLVGRQNGGTIIRSSVGSDIVFFDLSSLPENNIVYFQDGGYVASSYSYGRFLNEAVDTPATAITRAATYTPASDNRIICKSFDNADYESFTTQSFIDVEMSGNTNSATTITITDDSKVKARNITCTGTGIYAVTKDSSSGFAHLEAKEVYGKGGLEVNGGALYAEIGDLTVETPASQWAINVKSGSVLYLRCMSGAGILTVESGAYAYLDIADMTSFIPNFAADAQIVWISQFQKQRITVSTNYNPSVKTLDEFIGMTNTSVPRTVTISTEDITGATPRSIRPFTVKDESGGAATNNITIQGETGLIDGQASIAIVGNYDSISFYADGTNMWTY